MDERSAHPLPAVFKDAVFFSLTGFNPHGEVVDAVDNEQANVRLLAAVQQLRRRPRDVVRAFGHDPSHTWLERGMSLVYPAAAVRGDADIQSDVLALALRFRQSGVFRYDVEDNGVVVVQTMLPTAPRFDALRSVVRVAFGEPAARHAALASSEWSYVFKSAQQCADVLLKVCLLASLGHFVVTCYVMLSSCRCLSLPSSSLLIIGVCRHIVVVVVV